MELKGCNVTDDREYSLSLGVIFFNKKNWFVDTTITMRY